MLSVAEFMSRDPITIGPDDNLANARKIMFERGIRHIPVVGIEGELVGLVSQRDVLSAEDSSVLNEESSRADQDQYVAISSIMTAPVKTVGETADLRATAIRMQKNKLGCLPVVNNNVLVGIITDSDFVSIAIDLMEQMEMAEADVFDDSDLDRKLDEAMGLDFDDL